MPRGADLWWGIRALIFSRPPFSPFGHSTCSGTATALTEVDCWGNRPDVPVSPQSPSKREPSTKNEEHVPHDHERVAWTCVVLLLPPKRLPV
jgi:hypothetical protein